MARRKRLAVVEASSVIPTYITESRLYQRKTVTTRKLPALCEGMFLLHAPEAMRKYWRAIMEGLDQKDYRIVEKVGEMLNYTAPGKGGVNVSVSQQILQQSAIAGVDSPVMGFDAFVRRQAELRAGHVLPAIDVQPAAGE